ncbi:hypothetical protein BJ508DRAFT_372022 [Ascobolus immersus RN42]|uniref:RING-type domain-containing protein n=1 Tax=Ascobolus immersus RN42 TaxID=1160509 RepID=A0A3N4IPA7_ASCIM|nr:hypothetical protein BJ508DRAFT_372022 [Ascobolus immersus RN42]
MDDYESVIEDGDFIDSDSELDLSALGIMDDFEDSDMSDPVYMFYTRSQGEIPYAAGLASIRHFNESFSEYRCMREIWYYAVEVTPRGNLEQDEYSKLVMAKFDTIMRPHSRKANEQNFKEWRLNKANYPHALEQRPSVPIFCTIKEPCVKPKDEYGDSLCCDICMDDYQSREAVVEAINCGHRFCINCWSSVS